MRPTPTTSPNPPLVAICGLAALLAFAPTPNQALTALSELLKDNLEHLNHQQALLKALEWATYTLLPALLAFVAFTLLASLALQKWHPEPGPGWRRALLLPFSLVAVAAITRLLLMLPQSPTAPLSHALPTALGLLGLAAALHLLAARTGKTR